MQTELIEHPSTILTSPTGEVVVPAALRRYHPTIATPKEIRALTRLPDLTVVWAERIDTLLSHKAFLRALSDRLEQTPGPSKIVFLFKSRPRAASERAGAKMLVALFEYFTRPFDLEIAPGIDSVEDALREAVAKIVATRNRAGHRGSQKDALGKVKRVIESTADLRAPSGKLSASKVAAAYGLSVAELAGLIGRSRQAVSKTPDADSLQPLLRPFERVARLRATLSIGAFRQWLHLANDQLGDRTPLESVRHGKVHVVADLVEDMLTGSPT